MRIFILMAAIAGFSTTAHAYIASPGCDFRYFGGTHNIPKVDGFKVVAIPPEYQELQIYGQTKAHYRTERRPAWDGGPMDYVKTEIRPAQNSQIQRKLIRPGYFIVKDADDHQIGQFDQVVDVQNYVCQVIIPTFGERPSK